MTQEQARNEAKKVAVENNVTMGVIRRLFGGLPEYRYEYAPLQAVNVLFGKHIEVVAEIDPQGKETPWMI